MAEDTAVLDTETPSAGDAAPVKETAAEPVNDGETGESDAETIDYEVDKARAVDEAVNAARADWESAQATERYKREVNDAAMYRRDAGVQSLRNFSGWLVDQVEKGASKADVLQAINPKVVADIASGLEAMVATEQWHLAGEHFDGFMKKEYPEWKPSQALVKSFETAMASRDPSRLFQSRWEWMKAALLETEVPKLVAKQLDEQRAKSKSAAQVAATKAGDTARANAAGPTNTNGAGSPQSIRQQARTVFENPDSSLAEKAKAYETLYGRKFGS